ncbi:sodium/potassium-transporting ATPase subunit beta-1-interacting protein isoform X2 [Leptopilina heterotoma]|uniref:sodium/potassium-transporting ATPase subunit beta-1-interacting protein isoform X2 n=1 Tax=Leptopilina heterotoma TaxID=63436 RepID=UPI001CAA008A|nr:sodium/potassium-transporting ATPase subunit beta-1-interacting protein isoform X2 [Leptopilina heterotoma]
MGICSRRYFLLTLCILQLITTIERQVFDFLGFMWIPILVNFFNLIFVILGFFGAFQYRPKYIISYCIWNILWLGWNIFVICFYVSAGVLDKKSDLLNFGTGSFSWWLANGPGCKPIYDNIEPEFFRPARPTNVTGCILEYEVIEILHASIQCILAVIAVVGGICLSRVFLEEDDSFDFVGGGDFGLAGHTALHPMYVSYSALPPPVYSHKNSNQNFSTGTTSSHQSTFPKPNEKLINSIGRGRNHNNNSNNNNNNNNLFKNDNTIRSNRSNQNQNLEYIDYSNDYSNPFDHLQRPVSPINEYDSLEDGGSSSSKFKKNHRSHHYNSSSRYSPVIAQKSKSNRNNTSKQNKVPINKPRIFTDYIREQPLRSFYSDPRLAVEQQQQHSLTRREGANRSKRDSRPLSMFATNF